MKIFYVGPRPITKPLIVAWMMDLVDEGRLDPENLPEVQLTQYATGERLPFVEDGKREPPEAPGRS